MKLLVLIGAALSLVLAMRFNLVADAGKFNVGITGLPNPDCFLEALRAKSELRMSLIEMRHAIANGTLRDPLDPVDPPIFEAQATYLKRLGLLLAGEAKQLTPDDFEPEVVVRKERNGP